MLTRISKILFIFWLINLSYLHSQYSYIEYLKKDALRKKSAKIRSCNEILVDNNKGLRDYCEYDTLGQLVFLKNWYNGSLQYERKHYYDEKGNLFKMDNDKDKPYNIYYAYYEYGDNGLLTSEIRQSKHSNKSPLTFKYVYDENLNLIQEIFEQGISEHYTYENDKRIRKEEVESDGRIHSTTNYYYENNSVMEEEINSDGIITRYYEKIFDVDSNLIETKSYNADKTLIYNIIYEKDKYGNSLRSISIGKDGENIISKEYIYEYYK